MSRITAFLLLTLLGVLRASAGEAISITNWILYKKDMAPPYVTAVTGPTVSLAHSGKVDSAYLSYFNPIALQPGKSVTFSSRLLTPKDLPARSGGQIRIGLYGVVKGTSPDSTAQTDLRGFVLMLGANGKNCRVELFEHATSKGAIILLAGLTNLAATEVETADPRGVDARVVATITKKSDAVLSITGFWGEIPFSFEVKPRAGDYTHLTALALLRGNVSGSGDMNFSNVKIRQD